MHLDFPKSPRITCVIVTLSPLLLHLQYVAASLLLLGRIVSVNTVYVREGSSPEKTGINRHKKNAWKVIND